MAKKEATKKNEYCISFYFSFVSTYASHDLQLTRWGCWSAFNVYVSVSFFISCLKSTLQYRFWKITNATMTTMNHIELGHGHHSLSSMLFFFSVPIFTSLYKNSSINSVIDRIEWCAKIRSFRSQVSATHTRERKEKESRRKAFHERKRCKSNILRFNKHFSYRITNYKV